MTFDEHDEFRAHHPNGFVSKHDGCITGIFHQVMDFNFKRAMPEHYNHTTDTYVRGESDFISDLHRKSDEMSVRMGFDVAYEAVDGHDKEALGVTDDGLEDTERRLVNSGKVQPKLYL